MRLSSSSNGNRCIVAWISFCLLFKQSLAFITSSQSVNQVKITEAFTSKSIISLQKRLQKRLEQKCIRSKLFTEQKKDKFTLSSTPSSEEITENSELVEAIECINLQNNDLLTILEQLRSKPSFRLFSADMLASCEYLPEIYEECYSSSCEIYPVEIEEVPSFIKDTDDAESYFELDGWARWDMPSDDYYDLIQFPESFTGYDGSRIWNFIHDRICFKGIDDEEEEWKADFNRAVSGLHSMIHAQVIRGIEDKIADGEDLSGEQWNDPVAEFSRRLSPSGENLHALENMYFTYMLILSAVGKAKERILLDCDTGKVRSDTAETLKQALQHPLLSDQRINIASKKLHDHAVKDDYAITALWEARMRTRELMRIMNCVQCNKCKLHGKVSVLGISTALQILVGKAGEGADVKTVHRAELAALITVMHKFSNAINYCTKMMLELSVVKP